MNSNLDTLNEAGLFVIPTELADRIDNLVHIPEWHTVHLLIQLLKICLYLIAYKARKPDSSLIFHTDRGGNYRSKTMNDYMRSLHITHSFSRAHVPYDNSVMESFFASLKREELYRTKYRSEADFRSAVDKYIIFYNTKRPHRKLQYKTPEQKEEEYALKDAGL